MTKRQQIEQLARRMTREIPGSTFSGNYKFAFVAYDHMASKVFVQLDRALNSYKSQQYYDEDGNSVGLVDLLSHRETIAEGEQEIKDIIRHIRNEV